MNSKSQSFGELLRDLRIAKGFSQETLADRARISTDAISALERGARKNPQRQTLEHLCTALDANADERRALESSTIRLAKPRRRLPEPAARVAAPGNLPLAHTSFLGRERAMADVRLRLEAFRLVTLAGAGGVGKTRLATEFARTSMDAFPDGVWLVEFASLQDPDLFASRIAQTLGLREAESEAADVVIGNLAGKSVLLILDNCEHLRSAAAACVAGLLQRTDRLRIVATSRAPLELSEESVYRLEPLEAPDTRATVLPSLDDVRASPAVRLFVDRIAGAPRYEPRDDWMSIADICRQLDGLPLAIELAAARTNVLAPREIAMRLGERFAILRGSGSERRHETLGELIAWSDSLLAPGERDLFHRLGVFAGRFTLESVRAICTTETNDAALLDRLGGLIDKSLIVSEPYPDVQRFRLLESIRAYLRDRAPEASAQLALAHATEYLRIGQRYNLDVSNASTFASAFDVDDLRSALTWTLRERNDTTLGARLASQAANVWIRHELWSEGLAWSREAAAVVANDEATAASLWHGMSTLLNRMNRLTEALDASEHALAHARAAGIGWRIAGTSIMLALFRYRASQATAAEALALVDEGVAVAASVDRLDVVASANISRGLLFEAMNDLARAEEATLEALAYYRTMGSSRAEGTCLQNLAQFAGSAGDFARGHTLALESIAALADTPQRVVRALTLLMAAWFSLELGNEERALTEVIEARDAFRREGVESWLDEGTEVLALLAFRRGAVVEAVRAIGYYRARLVRLQRADVPAFLTKRLEEIVAAARAARGASAVTALLAEGSAMSAKRMIRRFDDFVA